MTVSSYYRTCSERKRCRYIRTALRICRSCRRRTGNLGNTCKQHVTDRSLLIPCIQPSVCTMLRSMGAIKREMNNTKWFWFAIGYQCLLAYLVSLCIFQFGTLFTGGGFGIGTVAAIVVLIGFLYMLFRPYKREYIT